jgi:WD40 repeat protein/cytochrome c553
MSRLWHLIVIGVSLVGGWVTSVRSLGAVEAEPPPDAARLAEQVQTILRTHCYRCHGQDGSVEGGVNYITDLGKLLARKKIVPGKPEESRLWRRLEDGTMPPPEEHPRPSAQDLAIIRRWITQGAPLPTSAATAARKPITNAEVHNLILAELERLEPRARRFQRFFTFHHLYNAGLTQDELQTYRNALNKLVNSLSWGSKIMNPIPLDEAKTVFRIDLRWYQWDATIWNRILQEYPYGILEDTTATRVLSSFTLARMPCIRGDWFIATASRAPLYYDVLQLPASLTELERLLRVDAARNIQQERVIRLAFNGSGVSRFNRILERHDSAHGMYWRTYDFDEPPANLANRLEGTLVPDPRNVFAFPLGPAGLAENPFRHAGGEAIFALPNGLHAFFIANANNARLDKAPVNIVSDPRRPDRAVEAGVSCMSCHVTGIMPKADQMRDHLEKNPKAFTRREAELIRALYPGKEAALKVMHEDMKRFAEAVAQTGARVARQEAVSTVTLKYEADLDIELAAAEAGLTVARFREAIAQSPVLRRHFGSLLPPGGTITRQIWVQAFGDLIRELQLGTLFVASLNGPSNEDNTGELDPLESLAGTAHQMVFFPEGRRAVVAAADRSVRLWDVEGRRDVKRLVGHTASVWSVALSPDGKYALSGGMDGVARLWDLATGLEMQRYTEHSGLVSAVALYPSRPWAYSGSYDGSLAAWRFRDGSELWRREGLGYITALAADPAGERLLVAAGRFLLLFDAKTGEERGRHGPFPAPVSALAVSPDGQWYAAGCDDGTIRLWKHGQPAAIATLTGHSGPIRALALKDGGRWLLSGGADRTVRLWDTAERQQPQVALWKQHTAPISGVAFLSNGTQVLAGDQSLSIHFWRVDSFFAKPDPNTPPERIPLIRD